MGYVWCEICVGYVWCEICVGYVWCEIRQQSSEEPCDETSFGKKKGSSQMAWGFQRKAPCSKNLQCHTQKVENLFQEAIHRDSRRNSCIRIWPFHPQELANLNQKLHPQERRIETKKKTAKMPPFLSNILQGLCFNCEYFLRVQKKKVENDRSQRSRDSRDPQLSAKSVTLWT